MAVRRKGTRKVATPRAQGLSLPTELKPVDGDFGHYLLLVYGREKIGKSTLFSSFPNALFATTEPGTKGLQIYEFNWQDGGVRDWSLFLAMVDLVCGAKHKFETVVIDTTDRLYDYCLDYVCDTRGIEYPGRDASGDEDYGKSWRAVKQEFTGAIHRLVQAGIGVCFTSHAKEQQIRTRSGERYTRIFPSMSNQARAVVEALVDFFFYAEYMRVDGVNMRVLVCEGDETVWAGARPGITDSFPQFLPLEAKGGYEIIASAFRGEYCGLDPAVMLATKATTQTGKEFIQRARASSKRKATVLKGGAHKVKRGAKAER